ncbi:hypothetical protein [uncultured Sphingomonas sp.]|uniref:hypothetical protein n=1 Tax=uncultured Sphingomonas sp. TaxID=158754 RepID=UPI0025D6AF1C|nr:hypothetical protein [uncultured Sphingomonas sp.]
MTAIPPACSIPAVDLAARLKMARQQLLSCAADLKERQEPAHEPRFAYRLENGPVVMRLVADPPNLFLHFSEGARLADPRGLLRGAGRRGRYVCLGAVRAEDQPAVSALIAAAMAAARATEIDIDHQPGATA